MMAAPSRLVYAAIVSDVTRKFTLGRLMTIANAGARAYNGGLGAQPPAGSRDRAPGQGVRGAKPPQS